MVVLKVLGPFRSTEVCYLILLPKKKKKWVILRNLTQGMLTQIHNHTHSFFPSFLYYLPLLALLISCMQLFWNVYFWDCYANFQRDSLGPPNPTSTFLSSLLALLSEYLSGSKITKRHLEPFILPSLFLKPLFVES